MSCNPFLVCFGFPSSEDHDAIISDIQGDNESFESHDPSASFTELYEVKEKLGEGGYAVVMKACSIRNKQRRPVAVKIVPKENLKQKDEIALRQEYDILKSLSHSNIVQALEFFEEPTHFYVVLEFLEGGELFDRIVKKTQYNEAEAREVVCLLLNGIKYCHDHGIVHRDLKPENLLLTSEDSCGSVKIADFGLAVKLSDSETVSVPKCGTPDYIAPEVIHGRPIGKAVDMWSFGVIMFILLGGYPPFHDTNQKKLFQKICSGTFQFHPKRWSNVSDDAKDLIQKLLTVDPKARFTAVDAMSHKWVTQDDSLLSGNSLDDNLPELKKFNASRKLRVGIKAVMAANTFMKFGGMKDQEQDTDTLTPNPVFEAEEEP